MSDSVPGIHLERLVPWFRANVAPIDDLRAELLGQGRSNITYRLQGDGREWVLRRPPLSHVQPSAHDMRREFRVISALADSKVPVPRTFVLCEDTSVNDAPFYVMQYVEGTVPVDASEFARRFDESQRHRYADDLVDILAHLHSIKPADVGLADFGKPDGYLERQVRRFREQLARVKTRELPELEVLARRLSAALPTESDAAIVHGDYKVDNTIVDDQGHTVAILDWEMATLGDPLADVGLLMMYWADPDEASRRTGPRLASKAITGLPGFPTRDEAAARYAERSGRNLSNLDFYTVLAHFKMAIILENMHARFLGGGTVGAGFEAIGQQVELLANRGREIANRSSMTALRG